MQSRQVRRLPVLSRDKRLVGIVSLGDIAISSNPAFSGMALREVSEPREPSARQRRLAERSRPASRPAASGVSTASANDQTRAASASDGKSATKKRTRSATTSGRKGKSATSTRGAARKKSARTSKRKPAARVSR
jgi:hypothetical protein